MSQPALVLGRVFAKGEGRLMFYDTADLLADIRDALVAGPLVTR